MAPRKSKSKRPRITGRDKTPPEAVVDSAIPRTSITDLPKELLLEIITYAVVNPKPITIRRPQKKRWDNELENLRDPVPMPRWATPAHKSRRRTRKCPILNVLLVCKDFYFAGTEAFYGQNTFHFDDTEHFINVKTALGDRARANLRSVEIEAYWNTHADMKMRPHWRGQTPPPPGSISITDVDALEGLPKLEKATVVCKTQQAGYWFAAASKAEKAKEEIREMVLGAWKSKSEVVEFEFPEDWGFFKWCKESREI